MKIRIESIPDEGLHLRETRPQEWWTNFPELSKQDEVRLDGPVQMDLVVQRVGSQVHVRGSIRAMVATSCARCLKNTSCTVNAPVEVFLLPEQSGRGAVEEYEGYETYRGGEIDLAEHLRGQLALHFPLRFLCRDDCRGLCSRCGADLNIESCACDDVKFDPRWNGLKKLKF